MGISPRKHAVFLTTLKHVTLLRMISRIVPRRKLFGLIGKTEIKSRFSKRIATNRAVRTITVLATILLTVVISSTRADSLLQIEREAERKEVPIKRFTRLEVAGPLYVNMSLDEKFYTCDQVALFGDKDLLKDIVIESKGETLRISMPEKIIPKDWIYASLECDSVTSVLASRFSVVAVDSIDAEEFRLQSDGGSGSLSGEIEKLNATVENGGYITLELAKIENAELFARSGGVIHAKEIQKYDAKTEENGQMHFFVTNHRRNHKEEIKPGVYLRSKNIMLPQDSAVGFDSVSYEKVKKKMEREYMK